MLRGFRPAAFICATIPNVAEPVDARGPPSLLPCVVACAFDSSKAFETMTASI